MQMTYSGSVLERSNLAFTQADLMKVLGPGKEEVHVDITITAY